MAQGAFVAVSHWGAREGRGRGGGLCCKHLYIPGKFTLFRLINLMEQEFQMQMTVILVWSIGLAGPGGAGRVRAVPAWPRCQPGCGGTERAEGSALRGEVPPR